MNESGLMVGERRPWIAMTAALYSNSNKFRFIVTRGGSLRVRATNAAGSPIEGARVGLVEATTQVAIDPQVLEGQDRYALNTELGFTDANGELIAERIYDDSYRVLSRSAYARYKTDRHAEGDRAPGPVQGIRSAER